MTESKVHPKVFISYSWTSESHKQIVKSWADHLISDGIDVIIDIYDLKEGQDKFVFMEKMVTDKSVNHVLIICDKGYADKADERKAGVGVEALLISKNVYEQVEQTKFIPIVCEFDKEKKPFLPAFLNSRIWIDFSSHESAMKNWEQLVRRLYGKPEHVKPKLGMTPSYINEDATIPVSPAASKFAVFEQAFLQDKQALPKFRKDFLDACIEYADTLRVRERPDVESLGEMVLADCEKLKSVRDHVVDWVKLEAASTDGFSEILVEFLEQLRELKSRPPELNQWNDAWFEAHSLLVYETFLNVVAALLKIKAYSVLNEIFTSHYLMPKSERFGEENFETFHCFYAYSESLQSVLAPEGKRLYSPAGELIKRQADRRDFPFVEIIQSDLLALLMAFVTPKGKWFPQTYYYSTFNNDFPLFIRATQHKGFMNMAKITGYENADELREAAKKGFERLEVSRWHNLHFMEDFWSSMNMDKLDTLK